VAPNRGNEATSKRVPAYESVLGAALAARGKALAGEACTSYARTNNSVLPSFSATCCRGNCPNRKIVFNATPGCVFSDNHYIYLRKSGFGPILLFIRCNR